ncbi:HAD family hydrolase [Engelhardtia mirabilis]|uniref:Sugar phosphatase YidA n=1 Tax=Engelhardtia mirabilis TaxID=2528011 RepID=A0A518BM95_9BACT|nr:Sugar phosphatase YidA [Planctomycetes bacterium Pla133]QDV02409.1 Sugar phosphatase YidA [Planctomycetes bacterium Pla86]
MSEPTYDAIVFDLDGTLVGEDGHVRPRVGDAVRGLVARGVPVMIATGRSELGTVQIARELQIELPCVVYNGAGLWCPRSDKLLEERLISDVAVQRTLAFAAERELLTSVMQNHRKFASRPADPQELDALRGLEGLELVERADLPTEYLIRISIYCRSSRDSGSLARELEAVIDRPIYLTDFPLNWLAHQRSSAYQVVDVQPPCRGKGEAIRWLWEERGIDPARVVAVGDATNDIPMFERAGLAVAMGESMTEARASAHRSIGSCDSDAIADLIAELF